MYCFKNISKSTLNREKWFHFFTCGITLPVSGVTKLKEVYVPVCSPLFWYNNYSFIIILI